MLDGVKSDLGKAALLEHYRPLIQQRASELHDQEKAIVRSDGTRFVQVPTGVL